MISDQEYRELIRPKNLFDSFEEVEQFFTGATVADIDAALPYFIDDELYEYAAYLTNLKQNLNNND